MSRRLIALAAAAALCFAGLAGLAGLAGPAFAEGDEDRQVCVVLAGNDDEDAVCVNIPDIGTIQHGG